MADHRSCEVVIVASCDGGGDDDVIFADVAMLIRLVAGFKETFACIYTSTQILKSVKSMHYKSAVRSKAQT